MINEIYLRRNKKVLIKDGGEKTDFSYVATIQKNIEPLGFILSAAVIEQLQTLSVDQLSLFHTELIAELKKLIGVHKKYEPFYPHFPQEVMDSTEARLYQNAMLHYWSNGFYRPDGHGLASLWSRLKQSIFHSDVEKAFTLKLINLGTETDFEATFVHLVNAKTSLSETDKSDLEWFMRKFGDEIIRLLPEQFSQRENLAFVGSLLLLHCKSGALYLNEKIQTATDCLRLAVALSKGDISLAEPTKFKKISRSNRRFILRQLDKLHSPVEDMFRHTEMWKRLGEVLHPGEYALKFPSAYIAIEAIRDGKKPFTFNSKIERLLEDSDVEVARLELVKRPGELVRRLDHLLRKNDSIDALGTSLNECISSVSTSVLVQAHKHFLLRTAQDKQSILGEDELRIFFPKGEVAKVWTSKDLRKNLRSEDCNVLINSIETELIVRFRKLPSLGNCFLDSKLVDFMIPFSQRSASKALRTIARGSRLPLPYCEIMRLFIWWKNGKDRTDIDLSVALFDADYSHLDTIAYYNLKSYGAYHSGDIVDAPDGASEFIDLNVASLSKRNVRYIVMAINGYTRQPFCDLPECFAGWMARTEVASREIFEPRSLVDRVDLSSNTNISLPLIVDLLTQQIIWSDIALKSYPNWGNNVKSNLKGISLMLRALATLNKPNLHQLFSLHIAARGQLVGSIDQAENVFTSDLAFQIAGKTVITPLDIDTVRSEFL
jgi:hypothetical protein